MNSRDDFMPANWIMMSPVQRGTHGPLFRREFDLSSEVMSAHLKICGLGYYEAWLNGKRIGDHVLDPAQTDYEARRLYVTYDVTELICSDTNVLAVMLGDGWFNQNRVWGDGNGLSYGEPQLLAHLEIKLSNGETVLICTDEDWRCATGPVTQNNIYAGENYDARLEQLGWNAPGFAADDWKRVEIVEVAAEVRMEEQGIPPIKVIEEMKPTSITVAQPGCWIVDMGQNFSGWLRICTQATAGTVIRLRFAETLDAEGRLDTASTGVFATNVEQIDTYTCKGEGAEIWEPRFTYHGFRYVEIDGWPGKPEVNDITGVVVHTALASAGKFECSDERINLLHRMVLWTHRSNIHGLPEDCPARERCGWLGDAHIICEYSIYNFHGLAFWEKYLDDIETNRARTGGLPGPIAPGKRASCIADPDWMAAMILLPWYLYLYYGETRPLEQHWDGMNAVLNHFKDKSVGWILSGGLGDWCDPRNRCAPTYTPEALTTTIWFYECCRIMARVGTLLGKEDSVHPYDEWAENISVAFNEKFYDDEKRTFGSQTANAMALSFGLVLAGETQAVVESLVEDVRETHKLHTSVGIMGLRYLFEVLTRYGHGELALALMHQDTCPSFGDIIRRGATTLWEYWGEEEVDNFDGPRSLSHPMMGGFDNWFYNTLAGIRPDPEQPGFKHFFLEPHPILGLDWVCGHHDCPHGRIISEWGINNDSFEWNITVPTGTTATAILPDKQEARELQPGSYCLVVRLGLRPRRKTENNE